MNEGGDGSAGSSPTANVRERRIIISVVSGVVVAALATAGIFVWVNVANANQATASRCASALSAADAAKSQTVTPLTDAKATLASSSDAAIQASVPGATAYSAKSGATTLITNLNNAVSELTKDNSLSTTCTSDADAATIRTGTATLTAATAKLTAANTALSDDVKQFRDSENVRIAADKAAQNAASAAAAAAAPPAQDATQKLYILGTDDDPSKHCDGTFYLGSGWYVSDDHTISNTTAPGSKLTISCTRLSGYGLQTGSASELLDAHARGVFGPGDAHPQTVIGVPGVRLSGGIDGVMVWMAGQGSALITITWVDPQGEINPADDVLWQQLIAAVPNAR